MIMAASRPCCPSPLVGEGGDPCAAWGGREVSPRRATCLGGEAPHLGPLPQGGPYKTSSPSGRGQGQRYRGGAKSLKGSNLPSPRLSPALGETEGFRCRDRRTKASPRASGRRRFAKRTQGEREVS